jgi:uncharacterized protein YjeT (DUF2065 family)
MPGQGLLAQVLLTAALAFLFAVSLLGIAVGLGLLIKRAETMAFISLMNRWVSMRRTLEPLERPIHLGAESTSRRWLAALLVAGGAYAAVVLIGAFDIERLSLALKIDPRRSAASLGLEALKWTLVIGGIAAVLVGLMLLFFPQAWRRVEERANRWYSTRELELAGDTLYLPLERTVQAHPRVAGGLILAFSLAAAIASGLTLFTPR